MQPLPVMSNCGLPQYVDFLAHFHLPSKTVVAGTHSSFRSVLYNNIKCAADWTWEDAPICRCAEWKVSHPNLEMTNGHVASPAHLLTLSERLRQYLEFSADSQVYPKKSYYLQETWRKVSEWCVIMVYLMFNIKTGYSLWITNDVYMNKMPRCLSSSKMCCLYVTC